MTAVGTNERDGASAAAELQSLLASPDTAASLRGIVEHLDVVHLAVVSLDGLLRRSETVVDSLADGVAELKGLGDPEMVQAIGVLAKQTPVLARSLESLRPALEAKGFETLVDPATVDALGKLSERIDLLVFAAEAAEGFLGRSEQIVEAVADGVREFRDATSEQTGKLANAMSGIGKLMPGAQAVLDALGPLVESGAIEALAQSRVLAPEVVYTMGNLGDAVHATRLKEQEKATRVGMWGLFKAMRDPDVQRAMGFFTTFLKEFGRRLGS